MTPIFDNGKVSGYQSVRVKPKNEWYKVADKTYQGLLKAEKYGRQWSLQISDSVRYAVLLGSLAAPLISNLVESRASVPMASEFTTCLCSCAVVPPRTHRHAQLKKLQ
ncbi:hypothetical protein OH492_09730 [Vibrio chagasii]|nr:hypothetical protein [Vibrio chagasii]